MNQRPLWCLFLIFAATFLVQGPAFIDMDDFLHVTKDVSKVLVALDRQFIYSQPLNVVLAQIFGMDSINPSLL
jgi:hypothetical protein